MNFLLTAFSNEWEKSFSNKFTKQYKVAKILEDSQWHCRSHEYDAIGSEQLAGGGGIQGLQRGTPNRPGLEIETETRQCPRCNGQKRMDRWTGQYRTATATSTISIALTTKILELYNHIDAIENGPRPQHELVIDHRFPMNRWGNSEVTNNDNMPEEEIKKKFQLLKKDGSGNHNLLKSRDCERCVSKQKRGKPFGINFYYKGDENWKGDKNSEEGCVGCGWYDFSTWREKLNKKLNSI